MNPCRARVVINKTKQNKNQLQLLLPFDRNSFHTFNELETTTKNDEAMPPTRYI